MNPRSRGGDGWVWGGFRGRDPVGDPGDGEKWGRKSGWGWVGILGLGGNSGWPALTVASEEGNNFIYCQSSDSGVPHWQMTRIHDNR